MAKMESVPQASEQAHPQTANVPRSGPHWERLLPRVFRKITHPEGRHNGSGTGSKDRFWIPRFWDGMTLGVWCRLVLDNRLAIHPLRWPMAVCVTLVAVVNTALAAIQALFWSRKIARTKIAEDPIFIVGHWRSGTTLLHELLVLDPRHTYPTTYECFTPRHFLLSGKFLPPLIRFLLPAHRPMDNMAAGWDHPQEDEFALANMGVPTPYRTIAFPNRPQCSEYLDLQGVPERDLNRWKQGLLWFLQSLTVRRPQRMVLKSPPHTCRIKTLLEMFPRARFVHIVRDPYVVFPSTVNLWKRLYRDQGLQRFNGIGLEESVFENFTRMYRAFHAEQPLVDRSRYCEVRYEDLVQDPLGQMRRVYQEIGLGDFAKVQPAIEAYLARQSDYKTNRWELPAATRAEIARRWRFFFERYGYPIEGKESREKGTEGQRDKGKEGNTQERVRQH